MLFKYLDNYFSKYVIIDYDKIKIKNFISKYYITEIQSEDLSIHFVDEFLSFYQTISNMSFVYQKSYNLNLEHLSLFNYKKASNIKCKKFYKYFDNLVKEDENYYNFMFLLEILELTKNNSSTKNIINYMSAIELLLVKGDKNISNQIQNKCIQLLDNSYSKNEFKLIYNYRSKIIHGDYKKSLDKLKDLSLIDKYKLTNEEIQNDIYLNTNQLLEKKVRQDLFKALIVILKNFIFKNKELKYLKNNN